MLRQPVIGQLMVHINEELGQREKCQQFDWENDVVRREAMSDLRDTIALRDGAD